MTWATGGVEAGSAWGPSLAEGHVVKDDADEVVPHEGLRLGLDGEGPRGAEAAQLPVRPQLPDQVPDLEGGGKGGLPDRNDGDGDHVRRVVWCEAPSPPSC